MTQSLKRMALVAALALTACERSTPEQQIVNDAAAALGGSSRLLAVRTLTIDGGGKQYNLGQDIEPAAHGQTFTVITYRRAIDIEGGRARTELTRTPDFRYFQGQGETRQVNGIDGNVGYNVAASGAATRTNDAVANDRRLEMLHHPVTAVRAALNPAATLANFRPEGQESLVDVTAADGLKFTLAIDTSSRLPTRVVTAANNNVLGDIAVTTRFGDYRDVSGLQLPSTLTTSTDDFETAEIRAERTTVDGDHGDLTAPAAAAAAPPPPAVAPATVAVEELARGVWFLGGGTHNSVLVEFSDHLTLIESPQNDARGLAVIAKARELRPGKPLTHVVTSHHHFDHTGGVRAAISEGLVVVTRPATATMLDVIATRPHTLVPDALSKNPRALVVETVADNMSLADDTMKVDLYLFSDEHAETMLYAHFPRERLVFEADLYNQGFAVHPYAANFLEELKARNLKVDRIIPGHGKVASWSEFLKDVAAQAPARR